MKFHGLEINLNDAAAFVSSIGLLLSVILGKKKMDQKVKERENENKANQDA